MRFRRWRVLVWCGGLGLLVPLVAAAGLSEPPNHQASPTRTQVAQATSTPRSDSASAAAQTRARSIDGSLQDHWRHVDAALKDGAYRDALTSLEAILRLTPNDPWANLYRSLCRSRLEAPRGTPRMTTGRLEALTQQLRREEESQHRQAARQKAMQRAIKTEQARWDQELDRLNQQTERERKRQQQEARRARTRQQAADAKVARQVRREAAAKTPPATLAKRPAPTPADVTRKPAPSVSPPPAPTPAPPVPPAPAPVEREAAPTRRPPPSLEAPAEAPGEGAVQIFARQMSVFQDRNLAVAEGDVEVTYGATRLTCDRMTLFTDTNDVYAEGRVRIVEDDRSFRADMAHYNFDSKKGRFLQGTVETPPWFEHGRWSEHLTEEVARLSSAYVTSCNHEPPHFRFQGQQATVFTDDATVREHHVILFAEQFPLLYLPKMSFGDWQSPFYHRPGKRKPWGLFLESGYRYSLDDLPGGGEHDGTLKFDWREHFGWGFGVDHQYQSERFGESLLRIYYNDLKDRRSRKAALPKGADGKRYRLLWRHAWRPLLETTMVTNIEEFSDVDFRKDFLFREEFVDEDSGESFVSSVTNTSDYSLTALLRKRMNRFKTVTEAFPDLQFDVRAQRIGDTQLFSESQFGIVNFETKRAHSDNDTDVVRVDWFQKLSYALNWFQPIEVTPNVAIRETYHNKDAQGGSERPDGKRDLFSGQGSAGLTASLKLFRVFPVSSNVLGLNITWLRHVLTPSVDYSYVHRPTVPGALLAFAASESQANAITFGLANKLQTKRRVRPQGDALGTQEAEEALTEAEVGKLRSVDLARFLISVPYTFHGSHNEAGGRLTDWTFDLELFPWPWLRLESDWTVPSRFRKDTRDSRTTKWNLDLVVVGGVDQPLAQDAPGIQAPRRLGFQVGPKEGIAFSLPVGQWYLGLGHRFLHNSKTETVVQLDWRLSEKWEIGTFHRLTWKEVAGGSKRFNNARELQYRLRRDLHDWVGEMAYHVDREFGEEIFFLLTLKAFADLPIELGESYHQPKIGSQSSPFSPVQRPL